MVKVLRDAFIDDLVAKIEAYGQSLVATAKRADNQDPNEDSDLSEADVEKDLAEVEAAREEEKGAEGVLIDITSPAVEEEQEDEEVVDRLLRSQKEEVKRDLAFVNNKPEEEEEDREEEEEDEITTLLLQ